MSKITRVEVASPDRDEIGLVFHLNSRAPVVDLIHSFDHHIHNSRYNLLLYYIVTACCKKITHGGQYLKRRIYWSEIERTEWLASLASFVWIEDAGLFIFDSETLDTEVVTFHTHFQSTPKWKMHKEIKEAFDVLVPCTFKRHVLKSSFPDYIVDWFIDHYEFNPRTMLWKE